MSGTSAWTFKDQVQEMKYTCCVDEDGGISGVLNGIRIFSKLSKHSDAKSQGEVLYYQAVIQNKSKYVFWMEHNTSGHIGVTQQEQHLLLLMSLQVNLYLVVDGTVSTDGQLN
ncbi:MAG: hypothetical protein CM15mV8_0960 [Caudoviricetes sp.]|nr:MAG: hypothetical protein CM15mV8_0960 [Caudoviricetes sp.]